MVKGRHRLSRVDHSAAELPFVERRTDPGEGGPRLAIPVLTDPVARQTAGPDGYVGSRFVFT